MEIRHLRYLLAVASEGTVTAAAAKLHVAQPAVSRQLKTLERDCGVTLFTRNGPRLSLTDAGRKILVIAADLVTRADQFEMSAAQLARGNLARLSVAAADTTVTEVLAPFVATLGPDDPFVAVEVVSSEDLHSAVRTRNDLGIAAIEPPSTGLAWVELTSVPLRAYVGASHPWARQQRETVTVSTLLTEPLILPPVDDPTRGRLDRAVRASSLRFAGYQEVSSPRLIQALATAGHGTSIATDLPRFGAYPVLVTDDDGRPVELPLHACWDPEHYAAAALQALAGRIREFCRGEVHAAAWHARSAPRRAGPREKRPRKRR